MLKKQKIKKCAHYGICGGCSLRHLSYKKQLAYKLKNLKLLFPVRLRPIIPSPEINFYRNRMDFACGASNRGIRLGLKQKGRFDKIINIKNCLIFTQKAGAILNYIRAYLKLNKLPPYNQISREGIFRYFIMREGKNTGEFLLNIVTTSCDKSPIAALAEALNKKFNWITSCIWSVSDSVSDDSSAELKEILRGGGIIAEKLGGITYKISYNAFFQTNTRAAEVLYHYVTKLIPKNNSGTVFDLYCGSGGMGLAVAQNVKNVIGVELNYDALKDAAENARINGINNFFPVCAKADKMIKALRLTSSDTVIVDPPRAGIGAKAARRLCESAVKKLIYVSCNPKTLSIDLETLKSAFKLKYIQPFDLFPHTPHIECVAILKR